MFTFDRNADLVVRNEQRMQVALACIAALLINHFVQLAANSAKITEIGFLLALLVVNLKVESHFLEVAF